MMNEWTLSVLPYILGIAVATAIIILRPLGRRLVPLYGGSRGALLLALTWIVGAAAVWLSFAASVHSLVLAVALVLAGPLAAGLALLAFIDARRAPR
jgi:hypothetical protein